MFRVASLNDLEKISAKTVEALFGGKTTPESASFQAILAFANTPAGMKYILNLTKVDKDSDINKLSIEELSNHVKKVLCLKDDEDAKPTDKS